MSDNEQTTEQIARRRLLKMASYVPPALLGTMLLNRPAIAAGTPPGMCSLGGGGFVSAPAGSCCPCVPISTEYNAKTCCKNHCDPAGCDAYVVSNGYSGRSCKNVNNWCGTTPAGCNCCIGKRGFTCKNPGQVCK
ncbi:hypothetical protein ACFL19_01170 [Pseudomonadota bacterium]